VKIEVLNKGNLKVSERFVNLNKKLPCSIITFKEISAPKFILRLKSLETYKIFESDDLNLQLFMFFFSFKINFIIIFYVNDVSRHIIVKHIFHAVDESMSGV
jgi:hypothetical protein